MPSAAEKCKALQHLWKKKEKEMDVCIDAGRIRAIVLLGEKNELQWLS